ncbi:MAG: DUF1282 domain-containing protein [Proteobacteria bacterium]|nr:DUF1282 domain-containing protein [Pseudomonadota bacterium]
MGEVVCAWPPLYRSVHPRSPQPRGQLQRSTNTMNEQGARSSLPRFNPDFSKIFKEVKEVITNPVGCWSSIRGSYGTVQDFFMNFLAPLLLVGAVVDILTGLGSRGMFAGLLFSVVRLALALGMAYLTAFILAKLAANFGGTNDLLGALKLSGYSHSPALLAAILGIIPFLGAPVILALSLYGYYIFYQGISPMLAVPAQQRVVYTIVSILVLIVTNMLVGALALLLSGGAAVGAGANLGC